MDPIVVITLSAALFLITHLALPHPPLRAALVARLGGRGYLGLYSLISFATLIPLTVAWWGAQHQGPALWMLRGGPVGHAVELIVLLGFGFMASGVMRPAPASLATTLQGLPVRARGLTLVTRHPLMTGISLWAFGHLLVNGWLSDVLFFGTMLLTAILGAMHQDHRKAAADPAYAAVVAETSFFPNPLRLGALDARSWGTLAVGVGVGLVLRVFHARLFGGG
jgi:uncharacterized membrane protein